MICSDVKPDSLQWLWQLSDDDRKTWTTSWRIDYRRAK